MEGPVCGSPEGFGGAETSPTGEVVLIPSEKDRIVHPGKRAREYAWSEADCSESFG